MTIGKKCEKRLEIVDVFKSSIVSTSFNVFNSSTYRSSSFNSCRVDFNSPGVLHALFSNINE